jgi:ribosome-associated protein
MIRVTDSISLDESEIEERFIRSSGPGGQNVNKLSTAVELRFDVRHSLSLPEYVREKLTQLAGRRITQDGVLVIKAQSFRTQERNRDDALARLIALIQEAAKVVPPRRATRIPRSTKRNRLEEKARRGTVKSLRAKPTRDD